MARRLSGFVLNLCLFCAKLHFFRSNFAIIQKKELILQRLNSVNFVHMKKRALWILLSLMLLSYAGLVVLQVRLIDELLAVTEQQFNESVQRSLYHVARKIDENEAQRYLDETLLQTLDENDAVAILLNEGGRNQRLIDAKSLEHEPLDITPQDSDCSLGRLLDAQCRCNNVYTLNTTDLVYKVVAKLLNTARYKSVSQRINFEELSLLLSDELNENGITLPFHYAVIGQHDVAFYKSDRSMTITHDSYRQPLFPKSHEVPEYFICVSFPNLHHHLSHSLTTLLPSFALMLLITLTFVFILWYVFRQRHVTELKNSFVDNMTHELKTPISSISLASQMLNDPSIQNSPKILSHVSHVIDEETRRLGFLVERVLQMSLFEQGKSVLKFSEIDVNETLESVCDNFSLKVDRMHGRILTQLEATNATVLADDMHLTNVFYNLMDNAVKYRKDDLILTVTTRNGDNNHIIITIEDNGMGIAKEHVKHIFDKFYRVPTGNLHNIKGFGLGLAYVKRIVTMHHGTIHAESELGIGTKFIIELPLTSKE